MVYAKLGDWRGKDVLDRDGEKIGKLEDVYVDTETDAEEFGTVKEGLISKHLTFVPLHDVSAAPDYIKVTVAKSLVKDAPNMETEADISTLDEAALYRHYGIDYAEPATPSGRRLGKR
jgi:sporulation protein YlmC with PRC-barrel domain